MTPAPARAPAVQHSRHSAVPYVLPFGVFLGFLAIAPYLAFLGEAEYLLRAVVLIGVLYFFSRRVISFRSVSPAGSVAVGVAVFALWIAPDQLFPGYREHWLFQNALTGTLASSIAPEQRESMLVLFLRSFRAVILVPIVEELFWRAWLLRWLVNPRFESIPLGSWTLSAVVISTVLFASEHGPFWDVGLLAGLVYNGWMIRTKSLGDCILAHAVTNACLSAWVIATGSWSYWL